MEKTMRAAIYARVSTTGQGQSPEMQVEAVKKPQLRVGWYIEVLFFGC
jgi:DNA invertase Pin-like site-specific DNA recombinase